MSLEFKKEGGGKILVVRGNSLNKEDYERLIPEVNTLIKEHGKIRVLFDMQDIFGWTISTLWEDIEPDLRRFKDIEHLLALQPAAPAV